MWPEQLMVESGESQVINCSTTCTQPNTGGLETTLHKTLLAEQDQWKLYEVFNISQDTDVICHFTCSGKQESKSLNISVFRECGTAGPCSPRPEPVSTEHMQSCSVTAAGCSRYGPHFPGLLDPVHGLRIFSHPPLVSLSLLATLVLRFAQRRTIQARFRQI